MLFSGILVLKLSKIIASKNVRFAHNTRTVYALFICTNISDLFLILILLTTISLWSYLVTVDDSYNSW
jgi:hypothetical protein